jgi:hypothetical protein
MMKVVILILLGTFVLWIMIRRSTGSDGGSSGGDDGGN